MWEEFLQKHYKKLLVVPILLLIFGLVVVGSFYAKTGDLFDRDVSLKGGISATIYEKDVDIDKLKEDLENRLGTEVIARNLRDVASNTNMGVVIEVAETGISKDIEAGIQESLGLELNKNNFSIEEVGSSLGETFYKDLMKAVLIAFILMAIVVAIAFRNFVPSAAVVLSAFLDILIPLSIINLLGIKLNIAGIAAFLLIIGYSVDTDILLAVKVLKRKEGGNIYQRIVDAAKTGLTMTTTTGVALTVAYFVTSSFVLKQMFLIIILALLTDIITTYFMNSGIFIWYNKRKEKGNEEAFWG
ncbi:MAG: hypothetical protein CMH63_02785 [Nanoarchaeota archaeon]|nr:hypothetical protein [Nanoarchaeota archaeon]|tara:strand:- start:14411 stop:15313 length:903 start_codon:yes stop_codon:yes gene_type:complete